jgi:ABC-type transporter Mla MlaB component
MDYCITFEVSPPSFEAPPQAAAGLPPGTPAGATVHGEAGWRGAGHRFMLPGLVEGDSSALLAAIDDYASRYDPVLLDCSRLARIDYAAAGALAAQLRKIAAGGRRIELRDVNHLVAALFRLLGVADHARLSAHRY